MKPAKPPNSSDRSIPVESFEVCGETVKQYGSGINLWLGDSIAVTYEYRTPSSVSEALGLESRDGEKEWTIRARKRCRAATGSTLEEAQADFRAAVREFASELLGPIDLREEEGPLDAT